MQGRVPIRKPEKREGHDGSEKRKTGVNPISDHFNYPKVPQLALGLGLIDFGFRVGSGALKSAIHDSRNRSCLKE